ncbi:MAG: sn-glycerol-3-phosphate ABC transporter ATP-binding protein UgpC [Gammaproteobacteria bacterium]|nr:MAG: sn-glycerol-3-phosphate ABC transporter ATP-binding protein UgpC [Gammaproteobacteria bacterium]
MARVELDRVRKAYGGGQVAVADATFEAADGELIVLVGPSGCGKSTLLRIIAGLESPTSGTVSIGGRIVNEVAPKDRDVAMVFQSYALYPHMTVAENLGFSLKLRGHSREALARRVRESAEVLGLAGLLERLPRELSGGQRQRVALGRALVRDPAVFLLDEPLSNLDAKLRAGVRTEIARLHRRLGATMIYVTHDQIEAMTLGQRIVVLDRGELQQIDTPMRVYERPANLFVAGFIGSPAMNFLRGRIVRQDGLQLELGFARVHLANSGGTGGELAPLVGAEVVAGLRPEDLRLAAEARTPAREPRLRAVLELIEPVGNEAFLNTRAGDTELLLRVSPHSLPAPGAEVTLTFSPERLHLFDPETGRRVGRP